ncbi:arylsulfatase [Brucella anthropi]
MGLTTTALSAALSAALSTAMAGPGLAQEKAAQANRPNIVVIVADDMGYSDIGAFGSEIATPNLDALTRSGVQLTNFHVAPTCSPTRSMLLSGTDNHLAGLGSMAEEILDEQKGRPGYEGFLNNRVMSLPQVLRDAGYHTYMAGKWHLGSRPGQLPNDKGFEKSFAMLNGGAHHFDQTGMAERFAKANYTMDDKPIDLPADFTYTTDYFTTQLIRQIDSGDNGSPFFGYLAYTAPHWPLQAPDRSIALFKGKYDAGYEAIRAARLKRMRAMKLIGDNVEANPAPDLWPHWSELDRKQQTVEARKMEVYAAMIHEIDQNVGRLVKHLKDTGRYDNTIFVFFSDNGAEGSLPESILAGKNREWIERNFDNSFDNLGRKGSYFGYGPAWASVSQTPFRMMKGYTYEGGTRAPAFIAYGKWEPARRSDQFVHVTDIAPTLLEIAGASAPARRDGIALAPPTGYSLVPWLSGKDAVARPQNAAVCTELFGRAAVWKDSWKLAHSNEPWGTGDFELYNIKADPSERTNLAADNPDKLKELKSDWDACIQRYGIYWNKGLAPQMIYTNEREYLFRPSHIAQSH